VPTDPRRFRPIELCRLLNSTPLGEVITEQQLRDHRSSAGMRIGDAKHVDLIRYVAWLVQRRHAPKPDSVIPEGPDLAEAAAGGAALGNGPSDDMPKLTGKQEAAIAALLSEPTHIGAAARAGVSEATLYRWLQSPEFRAAYRQARRELVEAAIGRVQTACGRAVEALLSIAHKGRRDGDRVRAAVAILDLAHRGLHDADILHGEMVGAASGPMGTADVVNLLATRLRQLDSTPLPSAEKARLTASLADTLLRAIRVYVIDQRLEALQTVLGGRNDKKKK
jgi:hypothetical protein